MIRLKIKNCNIIFTEKLQKHQHYHQAKLTNRNILHVKNDYPFIKEE